MTDDTLSLTERLRVWKASGMSITLHPRAVAQMSRNLDAVVDGCMAQLREAIEREKRARRDLHIQMGIAIGHLLASIAVWWFA